MNSWSQETAAAVGALEPLMWATSAEVLRRWRGPLQVARKADAGGSPVTDADRAANDILVAGLQRAFPLDAILAEESADDSGRLGARRLWCVDPIDGTSEFISQRPDFAVMVGLAVDGAATLGALVQPTTGILMVGAEGYAATKRHAQDGWRRCLAADRPIGGATVAVSRAHPPRGLLAALAAVGADRTLLRGSIGLKMAAVASGEADIYATCSTSMCEWDTCGPEALCHAAGARVTDLAGAALTYNKAHPTTPVGVVACSAAMHPAVLAALRPLARARGLPVPSA